MPNLLGSVLQTNLERDDALSDFESLSSLDDPPCPWIWFRFFKYSYIWNLSFVNQQISQLFLYIIKLVDYNTILLHTRLQLILLLLCTNAISESILMKKKKKNCEFVVLVHWELNFALRNLAICPPFVVGLGPFLFWVGLCNRDG